MAINELYTAKRKVYTCVHSKQSYCGIQLCDCGVQKSSEKYKEELLVGHFKIIFPETGKRICVLHELDI